MGLRPEEERHLRRAIELAGHSRTKGNHPFGSLLVDGSGRVVVEAENTVVTGRDVTGHAELNVVRAASSTHDAPELIGATLYTSTEPCAMCSAAIYWSGIGRVVFALSNDALMALWSDGAVSETMTLSCREVFERGGRGVDVSGPHLENEARAVHEGFWS